MSALPVKASSSSSPSSTATEDGTDEIATKQEEEKLAAKYGHLPARRSLMDKRLKERKYFDSGDYALSKAGKANPAGVGSAHPTPDSISHATNTSSPAKESSLIKEVSNTESTSP